MRHIEIFEHPNYSLYIHPLENRYLMRLQSGLVLAAFPIVCEQVQLILGVSRVLMLGIIIVGMLVSKLCVARLLVLEMLV